MKLKSYGLVLLLFCATPAITYGQEVITGSDEISIDKESEQIVRALDSLTNLHLFDLKQRQTTVKRLNKYGFKPEDIPAYENSVYDYRIRHLDGGIPMQFNAHVKGYIDLYAIKKRNSTERVLGLSQYYFPVFEEELEKANLPHALKYLAIVESALNPFAVSPVGATGIWQFMFGTGKMYDLKVNYYQDDRKDPHKATLAATKFFKDLYSIYGDWLLVVAAYNCGPGNVNKAIRKSGGKMDFWSISPYLPQETRGYVPAFIAVNYVMSYAAEHNLYPMPLKTLPNATDIVMVKGPVNLSQISEQLDMTEDLIALLNPSLKLKMIPQSFDTYPVRLPIKLVSQWEKVKDTVYAIARAKYSPEPDLVREVTDSGFMLTSNVKPPKSKTEVQSGTEQSTDSEETPARKSKRVSYTVKKGDNLKVLASNFDVDISEIKSWNNIKGNVIRVGQKITIMKPTEEVSKYAAVENHSASKKQTVAVVKDNYSVYTVKKGDTLWSISQKFSKMTVAELKKVNKLGHNGDNLREGMKLKVLKG